MNPTACPRRVKVLGAIVGAGAVVALGAVTTTMHQEPMVTGGATGYVSGPAPAMTLGETATTTVEPTVLATEKAVPPVKATPFGGSGS